MTASLETLAAGVARWLNDVPRPLILGLCGSQGSGKSTLAEQLVAWAAEGGRRAAVLSIDDLYLGKAARARLAREVHPLLATRGVPLTHDVARGCAILDAAKAGKPFDLPRFDKASDEPLARTVRVDPPLDLLIFEGWCVGARPEDASALAEPVNDLERREDPGGTWRRAVNGALGGAYQDLFARIDRLVLLAAPGFDVVHQWRAEQERDLRQRLAAQARSPALAMSDDEIGRFVQHYERITRAILREMPGRADLTLRLDHERRLIA